jgi:predicted metalloprotease with PDZ domain
MKRFARRWLFRCLALCLALSPAAAQPRQGTVAFAFTVSMPSPATHLYHVVMRCEGLPNEAAELRMPVWTPGYYGIFDHAANVRDFTASDGAGTALPWEKTGPSAWTVRKGRAAIVELAYDVLANNPFVANSYLDEHRGYITPGALFLYAAGLIRRPVTVTIDPNPKWSTIATGLDPVSPGKPHTYGAPDFDVLYDSPFLMGNLESLPPFEIRGVPHYFVGYELGEFDRPGFIAALRQVIDAGTRIIGEIPYTHYTFLAIGPGQGGIEHLNSTAFGFSSRGLGDRAGMNRTLSFLAHEYFHHYNVKRIRPIALGPFDYDKANPTNMLWVSEGFTVYYQHLMMARSGRYTREELLDALGRSIAAHENNTGRLFQSATESSRDTWRQGPFGGRGAAGLRKTISYYEKGPILGMLLDFKIRHETRNRRSLDDVMRTLYQTYYKKLGRGWTDEEFRAVCERMAGVRLDQNFEYASTTKDIDYARYLSYAGLEMEPPTELSDAYLGAIAEDRDGSLTIAAVESRSPAATAGLRAGDVIASLDGTRLEARGLDAAIASKQAGTRVTLAITRGPAERAVAVVLGHKMARSFRIRPVANPTALQAAILESLVSRESSVSSRQFPVSSVESGAGACRDHAVSPAGRGQTPPGPRAGAQAAWLNAPLVGLPPPR